jgi:hypothetical protein
MRPLAGLAGYLAWLGNADKGRTGRLYLLHAEIQLSTSFFALVFLLLLLLLHLLFSSSSSFSLAG